MGIATCVHIHDIYTHTHIFCMCVVIMLKFECWSFLCYMILKFVEVVIFLSILDLRPFSYHLISNNCCFRVLCFVLVLVVEYYGNTPEGCLRCYI
jgi:hypothetical protein